MPDKRQELVAGFTVVTKGPEHGARHGSGVLLFHSTHHHTEMARFANDSHAPRLQEFLDHLRYLLRHALLDLEASCKHIHDPWNLAQTDHFGVGQIRDMHFAKERQQVMLTHAEEFNVANNHEFVILHVEQCTVDDLVNVGGVPACQITECLLTSDWSPQEAFTLGILAQFLDDLAYIVGDST